MDEPLLVLTNCPDTDCAQRIAHALIEHRLAACVNQLAPVQSVYRWQGTIQSGVEVPLLIKSTRRRYPAVEEMIRSLHPHSVPEIIALPIAGGFAPYLRWIDDQTRDPLLA